MALPPHVSLSLRATNGGILRILSSECLVCQAFDPAGLTTNQHPPFLSFIGIWDTGASSSVITQKVVDALNLKSHAPKKVHGVDGPTLKPAFVVNMKLPRGVHFQNLEVTLGDLPPGSDALIGMDVITEGDFSITNLNGETIMSYRHPSCRAVDFVKETNAGNPKPRFVPPSRKKGKRR